MDITYLGHSSFRLRGKTATVVTDPYDPAMTGLKFPKHTTADIVTVSHDHGDHNAIGELEGEPFVVAGPGEYEIKGVGIVGLSGGKTTIYRMEIDGVSVVHLGSIDQVLTAAQVDSLDGVDILLVPVNDVAFQIVHEVEPSIVIPMHAGTADSVSAFLKEMGKEGIAPQPKLIVTKEKIPEEMQVVVLE